MFFALLVDNGTTSVGLKLESLSFYSGLKTTSLGYNYLITALDTLDKNKGTEKPLLFNYAIEGVCSYAWGGIGGILGCLMIVPVLIGLSGNGADEELSTEMTAPLLVFPAAGTIVGSAFGVTISGKKSERKGSFKKSLIGATAVLTIGMTIGYLKDKFESGNTLLVPFLVTPIGAIIGYNW